MTHRLTLNDVRAALSLPGFDVYAAWQRMAPNRVRARVEPDSDARQASVLILIYPGDGPNPALRTLLIQRTPDPGVHSGQIGFPGGSREAHDADCTATALREAWEEVGVSPDAVTVLGRLSDVYIPPSGFLVCPVVGTLSSRPTWRVSPAEVAGLLELPLSHLLDDSHKHEQDWVRDGTVYRVPYYDVDGHTVWGATAMMLSELESRLQAVLGHGATA